MLRVAADNARDRFLGYALELAGGFLGTELALVEHGGPVDVYYGNDAERECRLRIPAVDGYGLRDVPVEVDHDGVRDEAPFPFDLFAAMRFWLADEGNEHLADPSAFDSRGRVLAVGSAQRERGVLERPIVNDYLLLLREWAQRRLGVEQHRTVPGGKRCVVTLTHDVDLPIDPGNPTHDLRLAGRALRQGVRRRETAEHAARTLARAGISLARREGRHWVFDEVLAAEGRHGFSSVFFFAATNRYEAPGHGLDVNYDASAPRFRRLMGQMIDSGAEVGLHIGFLADGHPAFIERERRKIEASSGAPVLGSRHHFFMPHPFWESLDAHGRAGLRYDTSIGFNESPGYRLGVALPFRPWNPQRGEAVSAVQIPTFAMDAALFQEPGRTAADAVADVARMLDGLKRSEGTASLDWHEYTSYPGCRSYEQWGRAYLEILDMLASDHEVEVLAPSETAERALNGGTPTGR